MLLSPEAKESPLVRKQRDKDTEDRSPMLRLSQQTEESLMLQSPDFCRRSLLSPERTRPERSVGRQQQAPNEGQGGIIDATRLAAVLQPTHSTPPTVGLAMITGRKEEDRAFVCEGGHVMGVFDGHLGPNMAEFAVDNFHQELRKAARNAGAKWGSDGNDWARLESFSAANDVLCAAFKSCHETARGHRKRGGTTALVFWSCLIDGHRTGFCANAGDSRAVLSCSGGKAQRLSVDHTADVSEEVARVELAGGRVDVKLGLLVDPADGDAELKVTRGLGNFNLEPGFTSDPHVSAAVDLDAAGVEFVILGSDGLWDKVTDEEAVTIAHRNLLAGLSPQMVSHVLAETATGRGSRDDTTVIVYAIGEQFAAAAVAAHASVRGGALMTRSASLESALSGSCEGAAGEASVNLARAGSCSPFVSPPQTRPFASVTGMGASSGVQFTSPPHAQSFGVDSSPSISPRRVSKKSRLSRREDLS